MRMARSPTWPNENWNGTDNFTYRANDSIISSNIATVNIRVNPVKEDQSITFGPLADKAYGDADFSVSATASSSLAVSFTADGSCSIEGNSVHISGAGSCTITASQDGDENYNPATPVFQSFNIAKVSSSVTVTCPEISQTYTGSAIEPCTASYSGVGGLSGSLTPTYANNVVVGIATASASYAGDANHEGSSNSSTFEIAQATLTVTADPQSKVYGEVNPALTFVYGGFLGDDGASDLTTNPTCSTTAVQCRDVGPYPITCSEVWDNNYAFSYVGSTLTITPATLTVAADPQTKVYGSVDPALTFVRTPVCKPATPMAHPT